MLRDQTSLLNRTDLFEAVRSYLLPFSVYYPGIESWFAKVRFETDSGKRRIWAVTIAGELAGLAITKSGEKAKLCHFSVAPAARASGVGLQMMKAAMRDLLHTGARAIHVTTSDEVAEQHGQFFDRCGFDLKTYIRDRYRRGSDELVWTARREDLETRLFGSCHFQIRNNDAWGITNSQIIESLLLTPNVHIMETTEIDKY